MKIDAFEPIRFDATPCPECGAPTERVWITKPPAAISDSFQHTQVNGLRHPREFTSKQEHKRWLKEAGLQIKDYHACLPGSDKSKHGDISWAATGGKAWLDNAEQLATRNGQFGGNEPEERDEFHIRWHSEDPRVRK